MASKHVFVVALRTAPSKLAEAHSYGEAEGKAKALPRQAKAWTDIRLSTGEILADVSPEGVVSLTFKGCEFA